MSESCVTIAVSHNNRIQKFLKSVFKVAPEEKIRFLNCAVLKIVITPDSNVTVNLLYSGDEKSAKMEKGRKLKYYVSNTNTIGEFEPVPFTGISMKKNPPYKVNNKEQIIYLVRHGLAMHNPDPEHGIEGGPGKYLDSSLTKFGFLQAIDAGKKIYEDLGKISKTNVDFLMASDLIRSRQTLATIYNTMLVLTRNPNDVDKIMEAAIATKFGNTYGDEVRKIKEGEIKSVEKEYIGGDEYKKIFVVPCLNEIPDVKLGMQHGQDLENFPNLKIANRNTIFIDKFEEYKVDVNWKYYDNFYNGKMRMRGHPNCPDKTDIIVKILDVISLETPTSTSTPMNNEESSDMNSPFVNDESKPLLEPEPYKLTEFPKPSKSRFPWSTSLTKRRQGGLSKKEKTKAKRINKKRTRRNHRK